MDRLYRVEFNEDYQKFHLDWKGREPNTYGWFTVMENCTDLEFHIFESYVNRINKKKITKKYLMQCVKELNGFMLNLSEYRYHVGNSKTQSNTENCKTILTNPEPATGI